MTGLPLDVCDALAQALRSRGWRMASAESCTATCHALEGLLTHL